MTLGRRWAFGSSTFDERSLQLVVDGEIVDLERKPLEVMVYLLRHAGRVVTKNELLENLWPGRILSETVLTRCISLLRQALKDESREIIATVHGYGYRLAIPVRLEDVASGPAWPLKVGDSPPLRPQWKLVEPLGSEDDCEVWLARREEELRVFKIATGEDGLSSLKREVAIYRVLHRALGDNAPVVRFYDWNLEQAPHFIEAEHMGHCDLGSWAERTSGISQLSLDQRLKVAMQVAETVARIHSVGVVHGNLTPAGIFIRENAAGDYKIVLGGLARAFVLDGERLAQLGVQLAPPPRKATSLYSAPELAPNGAPSTKSDVYSLGIVLYQIVLGDLGRALALGWESDVGDELLRADIADAAAGNPARRIPDAAGLAQRLKTLQTRKRVQNAERVALERAKRAAAALSELKRARLYATVLLALSAVAGAASVVAMKARNEAFAATTSAKSVNDFLMDDVLRVDPTSESPRDASYESLLDHAAGQADQRFANQPDAAATVHWLLGRRYQEIGLVSKAIQEYERALDLFTTLHGRSAEQTMLVLDRLMPLYVDHGKRKEALLLANELEHNWAQAHGDTNLSTYMVRIRRARISIFGGELAVAEQQLRTVIDQLPHAQPAGPDTRKLLVQWFGSEPANDSDIPELLSAHANLMLGANVLSEFGSDPREAKRRVQLGIATLSRILGEKAEATAWARVALGFVLTVAGEYAEADRVLVEARDFYNSWLPPKHFLRAVPALVLAKLRLEQRRPRDARLLDEEALSYLTPESSPPAKAEVLSDLGLALDSMGKHREAIVALRESLSTYERIRGPRHVVTIKVRTRLAEALRGQGDFREALSVLSGTDEEGLAKLSEWHPVRADMSRVEGLIAVQSGNPTAAIGKLNEALSISERALGPTHWRTLRASEELAAAKLAAQRAATARAKHRHQAEQRVTSST